MTTELNEPERAVQPFLDWLEGDSAQLVDVMYDAVVKVTPSVVLAADGHADLRAALTSHLPLVHTVVGSGDDDPTFELPSAATRWARRMATDAVELSDVILAYDAAGDALLQNFAQWTRSAPSRLVDERRADALEIGMGRLLRYLRAALAHAISIYTQERELQRRLDDSRVLQTVRDVLAGPVDEAAAEADLSYRFTARHWGYVVWGERVVGPELDRVVTLIRAAVRPWQHLAVPEGPHLVSGWLSTNKADPTDTLERLDLPPGIKVAVGTPQHGLAGFRSTYRESHEARRVVGVAPRSATVVSFLDVALLAMASNDSDLAKTFVVGRIGPLLSDRHAVLLHTLEVWLSELGSPTRTSRRLGVHTNTVVKRLERIEDLLEGAVDPSSLILRVAVELAPLATDTAIIRDEG